MYPYENLDPEKFQQFCQALLVREFPNIQCFPVAQPDGGRDATLMFPGVGKNFRVFQVKFVRNPFRDFNAVQWLEEIVDLELPKITALIPKGAVGYHFITNVAGTAHPASGTIDKLNDALTKLIPIASISWWRDDLNRRLDNAWALKWKYSELMTGPDLIRAVIEAGPKEHHERRSGAIKAFVRDQYDRDQEVRFKQVELQNKLLDLFVDVPVSPSEQFTSRKQYFTFRSWWHSIGPNQPPHAEQESPFESGLSDRRDDKKKTAADVLLHPATQNYAKKIVIEGAPGQGKSTIGQYVCQVHRMRILEMRADLLQIPERHQNAPLRLPFRVDLRDLSAWLGKSDPFSPEENAPLPAHWSKSIESFLAAQVRHHSGGTDFSVDDLLAIFRLSAVLLVFDGLDEVADIGRRQEVVNEIVRGVNRLQENAASLQAIVTSRPAAFANSPGLPAKDFYHFHLDSVTPALVQQYAEKWLKARKLYGREGAEVRRILKEKMDQPHLRDLARNPMQLAILLSLIHRRGSSLPDKRTALYDNYIDLFFSREAEKSTTVREHRELLIDLHRYVAWLLHTEAEKGGAHTGSISVERLQRVLTDYLRSERHDTTLVQELFHGMVERVIALVSRVQGTLEFEVQPLREYFAARFLYETAPYSPPGDECRGTKPDRFDAIARNFYWLNVCRFYAGCFSKGELASLVDRLQELAKDENFKRLSHPRTLAAVLLSDWVFSQHPRSVAEVVSLVIDPLGLRYILTSPARKLGGASPLVLPKRNGNEELLKRCFSILRTRPPLDFALDIIDVIKANSGAPEAAAFWVQESGRTPEKHKKLWMEYGLYLGALGIADQSYLEEFLGDSPDPALLVILLRARQSAVIERCEVRCSRTVDSLLRGDFHGHAKSTAVLDVFASVLQPWIFLGRFRGGVSKLSAWDKEERRLKVGVYRQGSQVLNKCVQFIDAASGALPGSPERLSHVDPWSELVEYGRSLWSDRWQFFVFASFVAIVVQAREKSSKFGQLLDHSVDLCRRCLYACSHPGAVEWWKRQFSSSKNPEDEDFLLLSIFTSANARTILSLSRELSRRLDRLPGDRWQKLMSSVRSIILHTRSNPRIGSTGAIPGRSPRFVTLMSVRASDPQKHAMFQNHLSRYKGSDKEILEFWADFLMEPYYPSRFNVNILSRAYLAGVSSRRFAFHAAMRHAEAYLDRSVATPILDNPSKYPGFLVGMAEVALRKGVAEKIVPIADVAERDGWFARHSRPRRR